jgi:hypothetical protein
MRFQTNSYRHIGKVKVELQRLLRLLEVKRKVKPAALIIRQRIGLSFSTAAEISAAAGFCLHALSISAIR